MASVSDFIAEPELERRTDGRAWAAGWALALVGALASLLIAHGLLPMPLTAAIAVAAAPGFVGAFLEARKPLPLGLLAGWSVTAALAVGWSGGIGGPLSPLLLGPLAAAVAFGAPPAAGLLAALAAFGLTVIGQGIGLNLPAPPAPIALLSAGAAILVAVIGLGVAAAMRTKLQRARLTTAAEDQAFFLELADSLPVTTLALDRSGAVEARLGPTSGLQLSLDGGLPASAVEADRPALEAALADAFEHGAAETHFSPAADPDRRLSISLRRRGDEGLVGMVRELAAVPAPPAPVPSAPVPPAPVEAEFDHIERLTARPQAQRVAELEAALVEANAARVDAELSAQARSRFLANMSHELRTPLNAILGFSDIMKTRLFGPIPDRYGEYAELIHDSGRHLTDLINDVLDMSKIEADRYELRIERFDVREAVTSALRLVRLQADEAGVQLRGLAPREPLWVEADKRAMKQMVLNLVTNALKFTPKGGEVTVTTEATADRFLEITVSDTGVGIAPEDLERLGRPFEQAGDSQSRARGTGLGLSLVKALAGLHGGDLRLESALGEGTAATIRLPVIEPPPFQEADPEPQTITGATPVQLGKPPEAPPPPMPRGVNPEPRAAEVIPFNRPPFGQS